MADAQDSMECPDCMDLLADYVDDSLPRHQAELLEWHLEGCGPCVSFVKTYKGTVDAARRLRETTLPPELKEKLKAEGPSMPAKPKSVAIDAPADIKCPECDGPMKLRPGRWGKYFFGCNNYPKCKGTKQASPDQVETLTSKAVAPA